MKGAGYLAAAAAAAMIAGGGSAFAAGGATDRVDYEFQEAREAGALPAGTGSNVAASTDSRPAGEAGQADTGTAKIEIGGVVYRLGVDGP